MMNLRKSQERGHANHGWLDSFHTFSFADYYDPQHEEYRNLRVINEDVVAPGMGFGMHPHRDMEIITYVVSGELRHRDSLGNTAVMKAGDVQRISAGTGIQHSEMNNSASDSVHLLQIWIKPDHNSAAPAYAERSFASVVMNQLHLVTSKSGREGSISINQDADLFVCHLDEGARLQQPLKRNRHAWLQLIKGTLTVNEAILQPGDALAVSEESILSIASEKNSTFLLFDLN